MNRNTNFFLRFMLSSANQRAPFTCSHNSTNQSKERFLHSGDLRAFDPSLWIPNQNYLLVVHRFCLNLIWLLNAKICHKNNPVAKRRICRDGLTFSREEWNSGCFPKPGPEAPDVLIFGPFEGLEYILWTNFRPQFGLVNLTWTSRNSRSIFLKSTFLSINSYACGTVTYVRLRNGS